MTKKISCPICQKKTQFTQENPHRPFCSERCKLIDLGAWAKEEYKVPDETTTPSDQEEEHNNDSE